MEMLLHAAQANILQETSKLIVVVSGRRFGKTTLQLARLLNATLGTRRGHGSRPTVLGLAPTHPQARSVLFVPFLDFVAQCMGVCYLNSLAINRTLMTVDFGDQYPLLRFSGAHGTAQERLRGLKLLHAGVDEAQDISLSFLQKVILPALTDLGGSALFTGTPKSKADTLYILSHTKGYKAFNFSSYANTLIPGFHEELDKLRLLLPAESFEQEIFAQFVSKTGRFYPAFNPGQHIINRDLAQSLDYTDLHVGFDPGAQNRGWVIVGRMKPIIPRPAFLGEPDKEHVSELPSFVLLHAQEQTDTLLDTDALATVIEQVGLIQQKVESHPLLKMVAVDPSRPDLIRALRQQRQPGIKAHNSFEAGISCVNTLFHQGRIFVSDISVADGSSHGWFVDKLEGYHRKVKEDGTVLGVEDTDIATHTLDGLRYCFATLNKHSTDFLGLGALTLKKPVT